MNACVDTCPVCGGFMKMENQVIEMRRKPNFFTGLGNCFNCGRMRVSGTIEHEIPRIRTYIPICECCDSDVPVVKLDTLDPTSTKWACLACGMLIAVKRKRLWKTPSPHLPRPALAVV